MRNLFTGLFVAGVVAIVIALAVSALRSGPPSRAEVSGHYHGDYSPGASEEFFLRPDGTFEQELHLDGRLAYRHQGRWHVRQQSIAFDSFMPAFDIRTRRAVIPRTAVDGVLGLWVSADGRRRIVFGPDDTYSIMREAEVTK